MIQFHKHAVLVVKAELNQVPQVVMKPNEKVVFYLKANSILLIDFVVAEVHLQPPAPRRQRRSSPTASDLPPTKSTTTVTVENETKTKRRKKIIKPRESEEIEMPTRKDSGSRRRRRRTTSKDAHSASEAPVEPEQEKILGIVVHRTDRLRTDIRLRHPFVRVHLIDISTRTYVRKADPYVDFKS